MCPGPDTPLAQPDQVCLSSLFPGCVSLGEGLSCSRFPQSNVLVIPRCGNTAAGWGEDFINYHLEVLPSTE